MFIGGLDWSLTADQIHEYFENFGPVVEVKLKTDIYTGQSRGFAFLLFQNPESVDKVLEQKVHVLYGKRIDPKRAVATETGGGINGKKVFVGGLDPAMTEQEIMDAFNAYGKVLLVELPVDRSNNQRRSFGFVLFDSEESVNQLCQKSKIQVGTKLVGRILLYHLSK
ncbi:hypothetical protein HELRODRAFT_77494 [Helobdella robusta]|uniref:RRM domain-containing protein n=1 Tax=Helobdella robusta TaxID=6412 RepID=T1G2Y6_HELRO|nr:hypothetical protein HELRODRAFT_77494 [Helobdella robusta]ESO05501.1 hypothetical protein HELRODRAFT_77494 [Helobdella robusta]